MSRLSLLLFLLAGALFALEDPIYIDSGAVRGRGKELKVYRGIPYAAAPVGALRWRPSVAPRKWIEVRDAVTPGPDCTTNEDCLMLNVWTPAHQSIDGLPVMVWFHAGDVNVAAMDGTELANEGVVVVTFNYRVGVFGFLSHPELTAEAFEDGSGNYGLMDQLAALRWVQRNIRHFGGNPSNVTIFGESAGATHAAYLMVSPHSRGLFHRAIIRNPEGLFAKIRASRYPLYGQEPAEALGVRISRSIAALRQAGTAEVLKLSGVLSDFRPVVDTVVLPHDPAVLFDQGRFHPVPLLIGASSENREARSLARAVSFRNVPVYVYRVWDTPGFKKGSDRCLGPFRTSGRSDRPISRGLAAIRQP